MNREDFADIESAARFLKQLPLKGETEYTSEEREPVRKWVAARIKHERSIGQGTDAYQKEWFFFLHSLASKLGRNSLVTYGLIRWAIKTNNFYGRIYGDAWTQGHTQGSRYTYIRLKPEEDPDDPEAIELAELDREYRAMRRRELAIQDEADAPDPQYAMRKA